MILAQIRWNERRLDEAVELYRFASCLNDKDEGLAQAYFSAAKHLKREEETLQFLQGRFRRFAAQSSQPARTLHWALSQLGRMPEAFAVLEEALRKRPQDTDLLLLIALAHARQREFELAGRA